MVLGKKEWMRPWLKPGGEGKMGESYTFSGGVTVITEKDPKPKPRYSWQRRRF